LVAVWPYTGILSRRELWERRGPNLGPEADGMLRDIAPMLVMAQVALRGGHFDGSVDAIRQAIDGPWIHPNRPAH
jgi:hypothetical protein